MVIISSFLYIVSKIFVDDTDILELTLQHLCMTNRSNHSIYWEIFEVQIFHGCCILNFFANKLLRMFYCIRLLLAVQKFLVHL